MTETRIAIWQKGFQTRKSGKKRKLKEPMKVICVILQASMNSSDDFLQSLYNIYLFNVFRTCQHNNPNTRMRQEIYGDLFQQSFYENSDPKNVTNPCLPQVASRVSCLPCLSRICGEGGKVKKPAHVGRITKIVHCIRIVFGLHYNYKPNLSLKRISKPFGFSAMCVA